MTHAPYPSYRPSGVEWLGDIPNHWSINRLGRMVTCLDGRRIPLNSEQRADLQGEYPYWGANGVLDHLNDWLFDEPLVLLGEDGAPFFDQHKCVAFAVSGKIWVNNHAHVLRPTHIHQDFLTHSLNIADYSAFIDGSTRDKLTQGDMNAIPVLVPPRAEQHAIAAFLDHETAKVDALVAKKQQLIDRLAEYRSALITRTVTKGLPPDAASAEGLDPSPPLKPSGVEWLGNVPEHWDVKHLRRIVQLEAGDGITSDEIHEDGDFPVFGGNGIRGFADRFTHDGEFVLIGRQGALCGNVHLARGRFWASEHAVVATPKDVESVSWLWRLLDAMKLNRYSIAAAQPGLAVDRIRALGVPLPPRDEQLAIASFLDSQTGRIDALSSRVEAAVERLQEYRTALITSAVTGKIDVRDFASVETGSSAA